jgi:hypothetical protein
MASGVLLCTRFARAFGYKRPRFDSLSLSVIFVLNGQVVPIELDFTSGQAAGAANI